ncbi:hypothetical protein [Neptunomonas sp.]|uniref:hypothetical protein n=1 Tax=Neptunomonas sp. TaxID=1971898 RepID=UPI00356732F4
MNVCSILTPILTSETAYLQPRAPPKFFAPYATVALFATPIPIAYTTVILSLLLHHCYYNPVVTLLLLGQ